MESHGHIDAIALRDNDNVATALRDLVAGEEIVVGILERSVSVCVRQSIPFGHKLAMTDIPQGANVFKYGEVMGRATQAIPAGAHAHVHNIESLRGRGDLEAKGVGHGV
jgi:altronate dehydratase small subunit